MISFLIWDCNNRNSRFSCPEDEIRKEIQFEYHEIEPPTWLLKKHLTGDILKTQDILPVLLSMVVIILVAVLEKQSKFAAAITATMPIGTTLAIWIVYSANSGDQQTMRDFSVGLLMGIIPSIGFLIAALLSSRAGLKLVPMLLVGYLVWGALLGMIILLRKVLGFLSRRNLILHAGDLMRGDNADSAECRNHI